MASELQKCAYDRGRLETPEFNVREKVWLESINLSTDQPTKKLAALRLGPFPILEKISSHAYRLELPNDWKVHNVSSVNLLSKHKVDKVVGRTQSEPEPTIVDNQEFYEIEAFVSSRWANRRFQYLVRYFGYHEDHDQWQYLDDLLEDLDDISEFATPFHARYPDAAHPGDPISKRTPARRHRKKK